jgi:DNA-directed RNA polymerase specialized sigma24 family protein
MIIVPRAKGDTVRRPRSDDPILAPPPAPLTLRNARGDLYHRLPAVEDELHALVELQTHSALTACVERREPPEAVMREESLAYFLREWRRVRCMSAVDALTEEVLDRISPFVRTHLVGVPDEDREDAQSEVIARVFHPIFNLDHPRGEYYQVRFWNALKRRCIDVSAQYHDRAMDDRTHRHRDPRDREDAGDDDPAENILDRTLAPGDRALIADALREIAQELKPELVQAFILRHFSGWPIEGDDAPTISEHLGVTARTVRNWLHAVDERLAAWRGGEK